LTPARLFATLGAMTRAGGGSAAAAAAATAATRALVTAPCAARAVVGGFDGALGTATGIAGGIPAASILDHTEVMSRVAAAR
jgi:hypothetical protein